MNLSMLEPLLAPIAMEIYTQLLLPELVKLDGQISSPDLKVVGDALLAAIEAIAGKEIPKA